jgi:hypothetical protein
MHERKKGSLKTGSGKKVTSRKQAIATGLSKAKEEGEKAPTKKGSSKKTAAKKTGIKSGSVRKTGSIKKSGRLKT